MPAKKKASTKKASTKKPRARSATPVTNSTTGMVRVNLYITARQHKLISAIAKKRGVSFSEVMRALLDKSFRVKGDTVSP